MTFNYSFKNCLIFMSKIADKKLLIVYYDLGLLRVLTIYKQYTYNCKQDHPYKKSIVEQFQLITKKKD